MKKGGRGGGRGGRAVINLLRFSWLVALGVYAISSLHSLS